MAIGKSEYEQAIRERDVAEKVIQQYHREQQELFQERLASGVPFTDEDLVYSRTSLCPCGHGLAYPKGCGPWHYWDCSAILKGIHDKSVKHTAQLPFVHYEVKGEQGTETTRGVFRPKPAGPGGGDGSCS